MNAERLCSQTRDDSRQDLGGWVELRFAALTEMKCEGIARPWYDTRMIADLTRRGPCCSSMGTADGLARRHPLSIAAVFSGTGSAAGAIVLLDDAARPSRARDGRGVGRSATRREAGSGVYCTWKKGALKITRSG